MKKNGLFSKAFVYFLCFSFLLLMNGLPRMVADAKEKSLPIGEMVSGGEVKFEARENVWKDVESSLFPIFQGTRIKTEKGLAAITLSNNGQIEATPNSLFSFDQNDRVILSQGSIEFRIPSASEINFKAGNLLIMKSRTLQATKGTTLPSSTDGVTIGSIIIHSNGAVTVKSIQGKLSILNQDRVILAALSSKDSVTVPSITVKGPSKVMVAQADQTQTGDEERKILGLSPWAWGGIILGSVLVGVGIWAATRAEGPEGPSCF